MSVTSTPVPGSSSGRRVVTPSLSMVMQNGHAAAMVRAPVASASAVRFSLIRVPSVSSMNIRAPPAPQQKARSLVRGISARRSPGTAPRTSRGGAKTRLCRPR